jgi:predicted nicotinamide N-methyase
MVSSRLNTLAKGLISLSCYLSYIPVRVIGFNSNLIARSFHRSHGWNKEIRASQIPESPKENQASIVLHADGGQTAIVRRQVEIKPGLFVTVWEQEKLSAQVETFCLDEHSGGLDPFGLVTWPGSVVAAQELAKNQRLVIGAHVLVLGAGCGIEAQAAALLGATSILATDIHPTTIQLLEYGVKQAGGAIHNKIKTAIFDIASPKSLPDCHLMIVADVLYNDDLATHVVRRCIEARSRQPPAIILVTDSQRFVRRFGRDLDTKLESIGQSRAVCLHRKLQGFTGSGVALDEDQTYDIDTLIFWIGR